MPPALAIGKHFLALAVPPARRMVLNKGYWVHQTHISCSLPDGLLDDVGSLSHQDLICHGSTIEAFRRSRGSMSERNNGVEPYG
jgi:hypothetical protein